MFPMQLFQLMCVVVDIDNGDDYENWNANVIRDFGITMIHDYYFV